MAHGVDTGRVTADVEMLRHLQWKAPVRLASTANGAIATAYEAGDTVDGVTLVLYDRLLLKNQTDDEENGIYVVQASGEPLRAYDMDTPNEVPGAIVYVMEGTVNGGQLFVCTNTTEPEISVDAITFVDLITEGPDLSVIAIPFLINGGGSTIVVGTYGELRIPFGCTITGWTVLGDQSGAIAIDTRKETYANYSATVPDSGDSIWSGSPPEITASGVKATATGLSIAVTAGDVLRWYVLSCTSITRASLTIEATRT
jgi:hypothetical protein